MTNKKKQNLMKQTDVKKVKIYPKQGACGIPDILPANEMIEKEIELDLNTSEIIRAMNYAPTTTMIDGEEVPLTPINFNETPPEDTGGLTKEALDELKTTVLLNIENLIGYHNTISGTKEQANPIILNMVTEYNTLDSSLSEKSLNNIDSFIEYKKHLYSMVSFLIYEIDHTDIKAVTGDVLEWNPINYSDYTKIVTNFSSFKSTFVDELTALKEEIETLTIPKWKEEQAKENVDISDSIEKAEEAACCNLVATIAHLGKNRILFTETNISELLKYYSDQYYNTSNATNSMNCLLETYPMMMEFIRGIGYFLSSNSEVQPQLLNIAQSFKEFENTNKEKFKAMFSVYYDTEDTDIVHAFLNHLVSDSKRMFTTNYKIHHFSSYPINCDIEFLQDLLNIFNSSDFSIFKNDTLINSAKSQANTKYTTLCQELKVTPSDLTPKPAEATIDYILGSDAQSKVEALHYPDVGESITESLLSQSQGNTPSGNNGGITMMLDCFKQMAAPSRYIDDSEDNKKKLNIARNSIKTYYNQVWIYNIVDISETNSAVLNNKDFYAVWSAFQASSGLMYDKLGFRLKEGTINFPNSGHVAVTLPLNDHDKAESNQIANLLKHLLNNMENDYGIVWYDREFS